VGNWRHGPWSAASGTFGRPHRPALLGLDGSTGRQLHTADYRTPETVRRPARRGRDVRAGNSAAQIAAELAGRAQVTLAARHPVRSAGQRTLGRDLRWWLRRTGIGTPQPPAGDPQPIGRFLRTPPTQLVIDDGRCRKAITAGAPDRRPVFAGVSGTKVTWTDGTTQEVDTVPAGHRLPARPGPPRSARHSRRVRASSPARRGVADPPGPAYVGLEWQRSLSLNSPRGGGRDAARIARHPAAHLSRT
jgi:putative flavoprotein involved in K+ transport